MLRGGGIMISRNVSFDYYRIFYYVAKYKNLTRAAEALENNQPNVSRIIKLLEHEMGCKLLVRSNRGIALTPEGKSLYSKIKIAVEQIKLAEDELEKVQNLKAGSVVIGASETALRMLVLPVLNEFKTKYPDIQIRIVNHFTLQSVDSLKKGLVDFSVVATPAEINKPLVAHPLLDFKDILICGTDFKEKYKNIEKKKFTLEEITREPLVCLGEGTVTYDFYREFYNRKGLDMEIELEAATTEQILPMVKNNLGVGYIPEIYAKDALENEDVYKLNLSCDIPTRQICFVENKEKPLSIADRELKRLMIKYAREELGGQYEYFTED